MAELGLGAYRFSISWPRIQPEGEGPANQRGLDHYRRLVDTLNDRGIAPIATLFHWDLPQPLQDEGGWARRATAERFAEYGAIVHDALADGVRLWITLNEPWVAAWLGYGEGIHAPGLRDPALALAASHHQLLAHGLAVLALGGGPDVGIALNLEPHRAASADPADVRAARLGEQHMNGQFLDPLFGRGYPAELMAHYRERGIDPGVVRDGDLEAIAGPPGFLGINYYRPQTVSGDPAAPGVTGKLPGGLDAWSVVPPGTPVTAMGWPIDPSGLVEILAHVQERYAPARILITENGAAFDAPELGATGEVADADRIAYLRDHLEAVLAALDAGSPIEGYLAWSLLDNFEWAEGYAKRFGIVHVERSTQARTPKASARWFGGVARSRGSALRPGLRPNDAG